MQEVAFNVSFDIFAVGWIIAHYVALSPAMGFSVHVRFVFQLSVKVAILHSNPLLYVNFLTLSTDELTCYLATKKHLTKQHKRTMS